MIKARNKKISLILVLAMVMTMFAGLGTASAAGTISALRAPVLSDGDHQSLGMIKVLVPAGAIQSGDAVTFKLPEGWKFGNAFGATAVATPTGGANEVVVPANYQDTGVPTADANGLAVGDITVTVLDADNEIQITANNNQNLFHPFLFYIYLDDVNVAKDAVEECAVVFDGPSGTGFPMGTVTVARLAGTGSIALTASGIDTANNSFNFDLRVKEETAGSLTANKSIKLILPDGFEWDASNNVATSTTLPLLWGDAANYTASVNGDELAITFLGPKTMNASAYRLTGLSFSVVDESRAKAGDVVAKVKGMSGLTPNELIVGEYGDYGVTLKAEDVEDVYMGRVNQEVGTLILKETIAGSLVNDRYITFTLPKTAKWTAVPSTVSSNGIDLDFAGVSGSEGNVLKYTIDTTGATGSAGEFKFEDMEVALDLMLPGDLVVKVAGNAGVEGEIAIAKVNPVIVANAVGTADVKIGAGAQKVDDITITELKAGAIKKDKIQVAPGVTADTSLVLKVPAGCEFAKTPTVTVEKGDLKVDKSQIMRAKKAPVPTAPQPTDYYQYLIIPISNDSNDASTVKISDIFVNVDRTVAEGDLRIAVTGTAVLESNVAFAGVGMDIDTDGTVDYTVGTYGMFPSTEAVAGPVVGRIVTPAPGDVANVAVFNYGETSYLLNGAAVQMDVAPYAKNNRTYIPIRYCANALGISDNNIIWDQQNKTVTMMKGDKVVQLTLGSNIMKINGVDVRMDVVVEAQNNRTFLPAAWVAQAFGAKAVWDPANPTTVTVSY